MSEEKSEKTASERKKSFEEALGSIPVFPLPHVVLFPHAILPLHVFEPRYRRMLSDCLATHGAMVVAQILREDSSEAGPKIARVAGGGIVVEHQPLPDGRSNIVLLGQARLRLEHIDPEDGTHPYRRARATILRDADVSIADADRAALVAAATMFATEVKKHDPHFTFRVPAGRDAGTLADVCAYQLIVDAAARQLVLEELDPRVRVHMVMNQLALQHGAMMDDSPAKVLN
jgi:Lon protease-like protein